MFTKAITRLPGSRFAQGITTAGLGLPDIEQALTQHAGYVRALESCGLAVQVLDALDSFPDSTFIEDIALLTRSCAIILNPGAPSRKGETNGISSVLEPEFEKIYCIDQPGTVEGGDILQIGSLCFIGITERTNRAGAKQVQEILNQHQMTGIMVEVNDLLHLKTDLSSLDEHTLVTTGRYFDLHQFEDFKIIKIEPDEAYAANCLGINGQVLIPAGFPKTRKMLQQEGFDVQEVEVSEFRKMDGGLSCLSLRY